MLKESFVAATETVKAPPAHLSSNLKDVGIFIHELQPQSIFRQGFKKSSISRNCLAISDNHIFAAQTGKAVINVYSRGKGNQEATIPFPQKITSIVFAPSAAILVLGTQDGKLILWEVATGRVTTSSASHIEAVTHLAIAPDGDHIISASPDSSVHVWSLKGLVSFGGDRQALNQSTSTKDPITTFSQHRSAVRALAVGHAKTSNLNFVVSASEDKTCYVWNLKSAQILRTVLLLQSPTSVVLDPADRAAYLGSTDGSIQVLDLSNPTKNLKSSLFDTSAHATSAAVQLTPDQMWPNQQAAAQGPAQCITISHDSTILITGHASGALQRWDVAKHRPLSELSNLSGQSVTNVTMLQPTGFINWGHTSTYAITSVVKPRLELNSPSTGNSVLASIPAEYSLHIQVKKPTAWDSEGTAIQTALTSSGIPTSMLDAAIEALTRSKVFNGEQKQTAASNGMSDTSGLGQRKTYQLEEEVTRLRSQVAKYQKLDNERLERQLARTHRREALGLEKRQAFFTAKKQGKNGDEAMRPFMEKEKQLDAESDAEAVPTQQPADVNTKG